MCEEKYEHITQLLEGTGKSVKGCFGVRGGMASAPGPEVAVVVCTFEMANTLLSSLIEEHRVNDVCAVVVDEVHMLSDIHRGANLEVFLSKLLYFGLEMHESLHLTYPPAEHPNQESLLPVQNRGNIATIHNAAIDAFNKMRRDAPHTAQLAKIQIIAMSACLSGKERLASWLQAYSYTADESHRPI